VNPFGCFGQEGLPGRGERRLVVAGQDERLAGGRGEGEAVLDLVDPGEILGV
jgi:hypothetical protein